MDWSMVLDIARNFGFPVVMCGAMAWYVKHTGEQHIKERERLMDQHKAEMDSISSALQNNTIALTRLCERLERE